MTGGPKAPPTLLVIVGATASGKSEVAEGVARLRGGEIVSADAFAVYRGLDVGTAKPTRERRAEVPYHLLDVADPGEEFSAGLWAREAERAIRDITARGKLPIVCGGSGFYVSALLDGLPPGEAKDPLLRDRLLRWGSQHPQAARRLLEVNDPLSAARIAPGNLRYALRALEILLITGAPASARRPVPPLAGAWRVLRVGLAPDPADLHARIAYRVREMLDAGWGDEVRRLLDGGLTLDANAFEAIGYREVAQWVMGRAGRSQTEARILAATRQLARRQATWFRRDREVRWVRPSEAQPAILALLSQGGGTESGG